MSEEVVQETVAEEAPSQELMEEVVTEAAEGAEEIASPEAPAEAERPDFSRQFAALARKERSLRQKEQELSNFSKEREQFQSQTTQLSDLKKMARENPAKLLGELGINYDELTQQVINEGNPTEEQALRLENEKLQDRLGKLEKVYETQQEQAQDAQINAARTQLVDNIKNFVDDGGTFEMVQQHSAYDLVAEVMQEHYNKASEVMEYGEAAQFVEAYYMAEAERYLGSSKLQARFRELDKPRESETPEAAEQAVKRVKTLSNDNVTKITETSGSTLESKEKSLERVAAMIKWGATP
tara:strand:+ start:763 stop:1653 length:891 start_codon:yes stop_codon:yes gene_type:complete